MSVARDAEREAKAGGSGENQSRENASKDDVMNASVEVFIEVR